MVQEYWVSVWAKRRRDEVVPVPPEYAVHRDFTADMGADDAREAFAMIRELFMNVYGDIAENPSAFGMPPYQKDAYRVFSQQWRDAGQAPYRPFILLYNLLAYGESAGQSVTVPHGIFKSINKVKQSHYLFDKLADYGFEFEGLKNNKPSGDDIIVSYPDNPGALRLLKLLAEKSKNAERLEDFLCCHFRLLQDDMHTVNYGYGADDVADRVLTESERTFVYEMDNALTNTGLYRKPYGGIECKGVAYYRSEKVMAAKGPYSFRIVNKDFDFINPESDIRKMRLLLRIRNVGNCMEYLKTCPDSVLRIFTDHSDKGCARRAEGACKHGISYEINGTEYWRCGCCHTGFNFKPDISDIPHYIKLVELGEKK